MGIEKSVWAENNPKIASQATGWDPYQHGHKPSEKLSWKCLHGHLWNATIYDRLSGRSECPHCAGTFNVITNSKFWTKKLESIYLSLFGLSVWALVLFNLGKAIYFDGYKWNRDVFLIATVAFFLIFPMPFYLATIELKGKESKWVSTIKFIFWILISLSLILAFIVGSQGNNCLQSDDPYACWG